MRPVRLDIDGFASFREPATVEFHDVDYFSLVGPTGSGKSTIIDAITFALYGTAHRWERSNAVSYALAPTTNRCTVSLIFDVSGQRYQVVREVRRVGSQIQQKNARLERFHDPTACPAPGDPPPETDVLASEVRDVTPAVADLLGMEFDDFCQCVVLPQGEFARFLKATPRERQTILLKLLGAGHYEQIGKLAGARAKDAEREFQILSDQLAGLAHATPEAVTVAVGRHDQLADLNDRIAHLVAPLTAAHAAQAEHRTRLEQAVHATSVLSQIQAPAGLTDRHAAVTQAREAHIAATSSATATAAALTKATEAAESGPQRATVERIEQRYAEAAQTSTNLAAATQDADAKADLTAKAAHSSDTAQQILTQTRAAAQQAQTAHADAASRVAFLETKRDRLLEVTAPPDLAEVADEARTVAAAFDQATAAYDIAKDAATQASAACEGLPDPRTLRTLESDQAALLAQVHAWEGEQATLTELEEAQAAAQRALDDTAAAVDAAWTALEAARTHDAAVALRPALVVGHECPVCTQTVTEVPPAGDTSRVQEATASWDAAQKARAVATEVHQASVRALDARTAQHEVRRAGLTATVEKVTAAITRVAADAGTEPAGQFPNAGWRLGAAGIEAFTSTVTRTLSAVQERCTESFTGRTQANDAVTAAERTREDARDAVTKARQRADGTRSALVRAHASVTADEAPAVDTTTLEDAVAGWGALTAWCSEQVAWIDTDLLPEARDVATTAGTRLREATEALTTAEATAQTAARQATEAASAAAAASARVEHLTGRSAELASELDGAPPRADLPALLTEAQSLADARRDAARGAEGAQLAATTAAATLAAAQAAVAADRDALGSARDSAAVWGPPTFEATRLADDLPGCFDELVTWAAARAAEATTQAEEARGSEQTAATEVQTRLAVLISALTDHALDTVGVEADPRSAERIAAVAHTQAAADLARLEDARNRVESLQGKIAIAREQALVAGELRTLLRSDKFQQWLATAALDNLVDGASTGLSELSDGQFTLTHDKGEFFVIDHFDADSRRSVRTLSGGETFQASLALALALSDQLASLAIGGNAKLDSIFLDEGFGTLDPDALETVAATLENLAQGERMVGVVTHVAALAERTPVRFLVSHDNRTSRVERDAG